MRKGSRPGLRSDLAALRSPSLWSLFRACWERFSSGCGACPWSCGFDTEALLSAKDSVLELQGSLRCLLRCCSFILGKFLSFPGDEAWAALAPAWAVAEGRESCFVIRVSKRGCGAWESPARAVTATGQKWVPFPPPLSHLLLLFVKSGYYDVFKVWHLLAKAKLKLEWSVWDELVC